MFVIFGVRGSNKFKGVCWDKCPHCKASGAISVFDLTSWFTLFFIPLIPFSTKYYLKCNSCYREWLAEGEEWTAVKEKINDGKVMNEDEFRETYKKQLAAKTEKAKEFREKFLKFINKETKKKGGKKK